MAGAWVPMDASGLNQHYYGPNGKNVADILNGKLLVYDQANFNAQDPTVQQMLQQIAPQQGTAQDVWNAENNNGQPSAGSGGFLKDPDFWKGIGFVAGGYGLTQALGGATAGVGSGAMSGDSIAASIGAGGNGSISTAGLGAGTPGYYDGAQGLVNQGVTDASGNLIPSPGATSTGGMTGGGAGLGGTGAGGITAGLSPADAAKAAAGTLTASDYARLAAAGITAATGLAGSKATTNAANASTNAANTGANIAQQQWDFYKANYQPVVQNLIATANDAGSPEAYARARGAANADVTGAFDTARKNTLNRQQSFGINPGSPAFQSSAASSDLAEGAAKAGALTTADNTTRALAYQKQLDVANLGSGIPNSASVGAANASNAASNAARTTNAINTANTQAVGYGLNTLAPIAAKWFGSSSTNPAASTGPTAQVSNPTTFGDTYSTLDPAYGASGGKVKPDSIGYASGGLVIDAEKTGPGQYDATKVKSVLQRHGLNENVAHTQAHGAAVRHITPHMKHKFASGGGVAAHGLEPQTGVSNTSETIQGPGTGTSDSVPATIDGQQPAALSSGEFVLNAGAMKLTGEQVAKAINQAGLELRDQENPNDVPANSAVQAFRNGGGISRAHNGLSA